ncbi:hypothetical protein ACCT04_37415, partial [Rhizobium ruizarguesonis]
EVVARQPKDRIDGVDQEAFFRQSTVVCLGLQEIGQLIDGLAEQIQYQPRSSTFAWMSFIRTFQVGQRFNALDANLI